MSNLDLERKRKDAMKKWVEALLRYHCDPSSRNGNMLLSAEESLDSQYVIPEQDYELKKTEDGKFVPIQRHKDYEKAMEEAKSKYPERFIKQELEIKRLHVENEKLREEIESLNDRTSPPEIDVQVIKNALVLSKLDAYSPPLKRECERALKELDKL